MSFFKKMTKEFEDLKSTFSKSDEKKDEAHGDTQRGDFSQHGPPQQQYGQPPQQYGQPPQQYGQPPYDQGSHYGSHPPPGPPKSDQPLPPGWVKQWDQNSQRWYFLEQATGRTQWEPPSFMSQNYGSQNAYPPPQGGSRDMHPASHGGPYDPHHDSVKKDKGMNPMGAAAGGLAVGAVGGALVGHAMGDDSDSERGGQHYAAAPTTAYGQPPMQQQQAYPTDPPVHGELPDETRSGSSVSSSDKEDVEDARDDYQEALRDGDHSDIEEAREDYEEELEETYD